MYTLQKCVDITPFHRTLIIIMCAIKKGCSNLSSKVIKYTQPVKCFI